jgi:peptidoglycan/xylan/chitin deacetylase (PgdA/CDA1 family)
MTYFLIPAMLLVLLLILMWWYAGPLIKGMPVLVYHKISSTKQADYYTVAASRMREQLEYITKKGYNTIFISDLINYIENGKPLPPKPIMIHLEDGFRDSYTDAYPLLKEFNCKANIFIVAGFVQTPDNLGPRAEGEFVHVEEAKTMGKDYIEYGLHTMYHHNYGVISLEEMDKDMWRSKQRLDELGIPYQPCFAYPYAAYNKNDLTRQQAMFDILKKHGVRYAFKVGDRLNKMPIKGNKLLLKRLTINGNYSMLQFKLTLLGFIRITQRLERILK